MGADRNLSDGGFPGSTPQSGGGTHEKCNEFLDRWASVAVDLGWTTLDLFGVHPEAGIIRPDYCGALVMSDVKVTAITANQITFVNTLYHRDTPGKLNRRPAAMAVRAVTQAQCVLSRRMAENPTTGELYKAKAILDADVVSAVDAFMTDPSTTAFLFGDSYQIDLAEAVRSHERASVIMGNTDATEHLKRTAVRTAILRARPLKERRWLTTKWMRPFCGRRSATF